MSGSLADVLMDDNPGSVVLSLANATASKARRSAMISIVIPAHNEASVIGRTLRALTNGASQEELDIIVVCNGCTDDTAAIARTFGAPVRVLETTVSSKIHALNAGDRVALAFPRIYIDADVVVTLAGIRSLAARLQTGDVLAVAPTPLFEVADCSRPVRAFYDIRRRLPSFREGIGGSGVYALSERGRGRFAAFPDLVADDTFVRIHFEPKERETVHSVQSVVSAPRTIRNLIAIEARADFGTFELAYRYPELWSNKGDSNRATLVRLCRLPWLWLKLLVYCYVRATAKRQAKARLVSKNFVWERDETSRDLP